jgi:hypothetical protein
MKKRNILGIGCLGIVVLLACVIGGIAISGSRGSSGSSGGTTSSGNTAASPAQLSLGQTASVKNWDVTAVAINKPGPDLVWSQFGNKEVAAGTWYVVQMKLKNTGNTNFGVNSSDFELKDGSGVTYKTSDKLAAYSYSEFKGGKSISSQVPPGVEVTYYLVYDINPSATGLNITFKQDKRPTFKLE